MTGVALATAGVSPAATAAIAIGTSAAGAAAGGIFGSWRERHAMVWQARDTWLRELRGVLDDAGRTITLAVYAFDRRRTATDADRDQLGAEAYSRLMDAEVAGNRITTRLGDTDASRCWQDGVLPALRRVSDHVFQLQAQSVELLPENERQEERRQWESVRENVTTARNAFFAASSLWLLDFEQELPGRPRLFPRLTAAPGRRGGAPRRGGGSRPD